MTLSYCEGLGRRSIGENRWKQSGEKGRVVCGVPVKQSVNSWACGLKLRTRRGVKNWGGKTFTITYNYMKRITLILLLLLIPIKN